MENPLVSIIVPVYNAELYLEECLNSLIGQTYKNLEILLIDDGSKDKSGEICDKYAKLDNRISVHHKPNSGVSRTRNYGLDHCHGEWVAFVDSDDYIEKDYIESFLKHTTCDLCVGGYSIFGTRESTKMSVTNRKIVLKTQIEELDVIPQKPEINAIYHICGKLYKNSIIQENHIRFPEELKLAEDCCFNLSYILVSNNLEFIPYAGYYYRKDERVSPYKFSLEMYDTHGTAIANYFKKIEKSFCYDFKIVPHFLQKSFMAALKSGLIEDLSFGDLKRESKYNRCHHVISYESIDFVNRKEKMVLLMIYSCPSWGYLIIKILRMLRIVRDRL